MRNLTLLLTIALVTFFAQTTAFGQKKKPKPGVKRPTVRSYKPVVKKVEVEDWKEFESTDLNLKLIFPKVPTVAVSDVTEGGRIKVKSSVIQSYINSDFYLVNVREYPPGIIPDRTDLGEGFGLWLKTFVLFDVKVISQKTFDVGRYKTVEFVYQQSETDVLVHRSLIVGNRLYQVIVQYEVKKPETVEQTIQRNKAKLDKFFLSFEITGDEFIS